MNIITKSLILKSGLILGLAVTTFAQTPLSGFMQGKNGGNITYSISSENYNKVFLVPDKIDGVPVFEQVTTNSFNIYGTYGFSDKLDIVVNVPYIRAIGSGNQAVINDLGYQNSREGLQDLAAYLKYNFLQKGKLSVQGSVGVTTPLSDYKVNEALQSIVAIGNQATTYNGILLAHYRADNGLFVTGQVGYSFRSTDVPDAVLSQLKFGVALNRFYFDGFIANQTSTSGVDILRSGFTGFFPATQVNYTKVGGSLYTPLDGNFGITGGGSYVVDGRNIGQAYSFNAGLVYNFKYRNL